MSTNIKVSYSHEPIKNEDYYCYKVEIGVPHHDESATINVYAPFSDGIALKYVLDSVIPADKDRKIDVYRPVKITDDFIKSAHVGNYSILQAIRIVKTLKFTGTRERVIVEEVEF